MPQAAIRFSACLAILSFSLVAEDRKFAGTWEARFEGRVFLTVKILSDAKISGNVSTGSITVDEQGTLINGKPAAVASACEILRAHSDGDTLFFEIVDGDDGPMKLELHITGEGRAELRFIDTPATIKPLPLIRS